MSIYVYPAVFHPEEGGEYSVEFPDLPGCFTAGASLAEAMTMAHEAMGLYLFTLEEDGKAIPVASPLGDVHTEPGQFVSLIDVDMLEHRKKYDNRAVTRTVTVPAWLNTMAQANSINFSQTLQAALKERLGLTDQR
jgi:antitoxin HicB